MSLIRRCISIAKAGFNYKKLERMSKSLEAVLPEVKKRFPYRVGLLAKKYQTQLMYNSPYDTGHLEGSWVYEIEQAGEYTYLIRAWNIALSKNGVLYAEFVNDGHRIVSHGYTMGWLPGQHFIEFTDWEMIEKYIPNWKTNFEREIARMIRNAIS